MATITVTVEIESWDGDTELELDSANFVRNAIMQVAERFGRIYPGNVMVSSDVSPS